MKPKLSEGQRALLQKLCKAYGGTIPQFALKPVESRYGTQMERRGLTAWKTYPAYKKLHITEAGREALED